jgi:hypothetical protein
MAIIKLGKKRFREAGNQQVLECANFERKVRNVMKTEFETNVKN